MKEGFTGMDEILKHLVEHLLMLKLTNQEVC